MTGLKGLGFEPVSSNAQAAEDVSIAAEKGKQEARSRAILICEMCRRAQVAPGLMVALVSEPITVEQAADRILAAADPANIQ